MRALHRLSQRLLTWRTGLPADHPQLGAYERVLVVSKPRNFMVLAPRGLLVREFGLECRTTDARVGSQMWKAYLVGAGAGAFLGLWAYLFVLAWGFAPYSLQVWIGLGALTGVGVARRKGDYIFRRYFRQFAPIWWLRRVTGDWRFQVDFKNGRVTETFKPTEGVRLEPIVVRPLYRSFIDGDARPGPAAADDAGLPPKRRSYTAEFLYRCVFGHPLRPRLRHRTKDRGAMVTWVSAGQIILGIIIVGLIIFIAP